MGTTAVAAISAVSAPATSAADAQPTEAVDPMMSVTLAQMIATRVGGGITAAAGATTIGTRPAAILRVGTVGMGLGRGTSAGAASLSVPDALRTYGNGNIPREMLTLIGIGQHRLWAPAAESFKTMRSDAAAQGVTIGVTDSYRTYDQQVQLAAQKGLYKDGGYAAVPGTSPHGWGMATDVDVDSNGLAWLRANGAKYGFVETTPREPWHWEYRPLT